MKLCDLTQFYSPFSGGVKKYVSEKVRFVREQTPADEHILIIPGERDEVIETERARTYTIKSPLISRTSRYRVLLRLHAIERILERERPDLIETGDPYQVAWKAIHSGSALRIPVVSFYHSHFPEAYLRTAEKYLGRTVTELFMEGSQRYIRSLYNRFARTFVPSPALGCVLTEWGVRNVIHTDLGVDTSVFRPACGEQHIEHRTPNVEHRSHKHRDTALSSSEFDVRRSTFDVSANSQSVRASLGIRPEQTMLLYVGRLAQEKNTHTLFSAFRSLAETHPGRFHLLVIGDGLQRTELERLRATPASINGSGPSLTWLPYCDEPARLAQLYRAADLFVHPGVQETFGLVTLEAQACGTPVIGIRGSYMDRIIHSDQTLWARENTSAALAAAIDETSRQPLKSDPELLHRRVAAQYSWTQTFTRLFAIYREVIHEFHSS